MTVTNQRKPTGIDRCHCDYCVSGDDAAERDARHLIAPRLAPDGSRFTPDYDAMTCHCDRCEDDYFRRLPWVGTDENYSATAPYWQGCGQYLFDECRGCIVAFHYELGTVAGIFTRAWDYYGPELAGIWYSTAEKVDAESTTLNVTSRPRRITRDEFDKITGLDALRREYGWR